MNPDGAPIPGEALIFAAIGLVWVWRNRHELTERLYDFARGRQGPREWEAPAATHTADAAQSGGDWWPTVAGSLRFIDLRAGHLVDTPAGRDVKIIEVWSEYDDRNQLRTHIELDDGRCLTAYAEDTLESQGWDVLDLLADVPADASSLI